MLQVKLLDPRAKAPTVAHPGEDLAYDLYALEDTVLLPGQVTKVRTGVAVAVVIRLSTVPMGLLIRDRSSMASKGIVTSGGVIDAGYRGEIIVLMTNHGDTVSEDENRNLHWGYRIKAGDKIAQAIPTPVLTGQVSVVDTLPEASRGDKGFGSSGS